ncbi:hypothetical protein GR28A_00176 [Vibrio phage vB_VcorM_GR28A]|nr:hypothetical protein GR28A_00176 [Vibrio phage vB_VcorM_GR28A]
MPNQPITELKEEGVIPKIDGMIIEYGHPRYNHILSNVRAQMGATMVRGSECLIYCTDVKMLAVEHEEYYTVIFQREVERHDKGCVFQTTVKAKVVYKEWVVHEDVSQPPVIKSSFEADGEFEVLKQENIGPIPEKPEVKTIISKRQELILD